MIPLVPLTPEFLVMLGDSKQASTTALMWTPSMESF